jgi:hypothetical protein
LVGFESRRAIANVCFWPKADIQEG